MAPICQHQWDIYQPNNYSRARGVTQRWTNQISVIATRMRLRGSLDYKQKLRYRVFEDNDEAVIAVTDVVPRNYHDKRDLTDLLKEARAKVARSFHWVSP